MEKMKNTTSRRSSLKKMGMALVGAFGLGVVNAVAKDSAPKKEVVGKIEQDKKIPLFSGAVRHGNTLYISGKGAHFEGDIKSHTDHVLNTLKAELEKNGSSMEQVLKVNNLYINNFKSINKKRRMSIYYLESWIPNMTGQYLFLSQIVINTCIAPFLIKKSKSK